MPDTRKISIAIPVYNRFELLLQSYHLILDDKRVDEIVIVDDASDKEIFDKVYDAVKNEPKIKLIRNITNQDCYRNKMTALSYCSNDFCIILDSDNIIDTDYLDKLYEFDEWKNDMVYQPSFAKPTFDFRHFAGLTISRENVASILKGKFADTMLNAMNYFVNIDEYLKVWDGNTNPHTADSIFQNLNWLKAGNKILVVEGLEYLHRVHSGSHYVLNNHKTGNLYNEISEDLNALR